MGGNVKAHHKCHSENNAYLESSHSPNFKGMNGIDHCLTPFFSPSICYIMNILFLFQAAFNNSALADMLTSKIYIPQLLISRLLRVEYDAAAFSFCGCVMHCEDKSQALLPSSHGWYTVVNCFSVVLGTLRQLSTSTSILADPSLLPEEAIQAVTNTQKPCGDS